MKFRYPAPLKKEITKHESDIYFESKAHLRSYQHSKSHQRHGKFIHSLFYIIIDLFLTFFGGRGIALVPNLEQRTCS